MASDPPQVPGFDPPWWLRGPHAQTIGSALMPRTPSEHRAILRRVDLDDGDALAVHDDTPNGWRPGGRIAILSHGLADHHRSPLLVRLTDKLTARGVRVFRWDMRCCGAGLTWARRPYHAGCSDDLAAVVSSVLAWCREEAGSGGPDPDLSLFGVSLSGNVLLKYLGEAPDRVPAAVRCCQSTDRSGRRLRVDRQPGQPNLRPALHRSARQASGELVAGPAGCRASSRNDPAAHAPAV